RRRARHERPTGGGGGLEDDGVDDADANGAVGARLRAGRRLTLGESAVAHIALADDAALAVVAGHLVGAGERAVRAPDALVVEVGLEAVLLAGSGQRGGDQLLVVSLLLRQDAGVVLGREAFDRRQAPLLRQPLIDDRQSGTHRSTWTRPSATRVGNVAMRTSG